MARFVGTPAVRVAPSPEESIFSEEFDRPTPIWATGSTAPLSGILPLGQCALVGLKVLRVFGNSGVVDGSVIGGTPAMGFQSEPHLEDPAASLRGCWLMETEILHSDGQPSRIGLVLCGEIGRAHV